MHGARPEENESEHAEPEDDEDLPGAPGLRRAVDMQELAQSHAPAFGELADDLIDAVHAAPQNEGPRGAVPESGEEEGDEQRDELRQHDPQAAVAGLLAEIPGKAVELFIRREGIEHIVLEPACQADMPAGPEFGDGMRHVGQIEVLHEPYAHDPRAANSDIGIPREIAVHLEGEHDRGGDDGGRGGGFRRGIDSDDIGRELIRDDHLLEEAGKDDFESFTQVVCIEPMLRLELRQQVLGALDGAGDKLREEGNEQRVIAEMPLGFDGAAVHVDDIAECLEGVERDTHGQDEVEEIVVHRQTEQTQKTRHRAGEEVEVFIEKQYAEAGGQGDHEICPAQLRVFRARHEEACRVGYRRREGNEIHEIRIPAHVKIVAGGEEHDPAVFRGDHEMQERHDGEKDQVFERIEGHALLPPRCRISPRTAESR